MLNWFYNWLDPKILRLEKWVNHQIIQPDKIDIDLDKIKKGEVRDNPMYRQPPSTGEFGPFITNLQGGTTLEFLLGADEMEAFAMVNHDDALWWRHRHAGTTSDFKHPAFENMQEFFMYIHGDESEYWTCMLKTKASGYTVGDEAVE